VTSGNRSADLLYKVRGFSLPIGRLAQGERSPAILVGLMTCLAELGSLCASRPSLYLSCSAPPPPLTRRPSSSEEGSRQSSPPDLELVLNEVKEGAARSRWGWLPAREAQPNKK